MSHYVLAVSVAAALLVSSAEPVAACTALLGSRENPLDLNYSLDAHGALQSFSAATSYGELEGSVRDATIELILTEVDGTTSSASITFMATESNFSSVQVTLDHVGLGQIDLVASNSKLQMQRVAIDGEALASTNLYRALVEVSTAFETSLPSLASKDAETLRPVALVMTTVGLLVEVPPDTGAQPLLICNNTTGTFEECLECCDNLHSLGHATVDTAFGVWGGFLCAPSVWGIPLCAALGAGIGWAVVDLSQTHCEGITCSPIPPGGSECAVRNGTCRYFNSPCPPETTDAGAAGCSDGYRCCVPVDETGQECPPCPNGTIPTPPFCECPLGG